MKKKEPIWHGWSRDGAALHIGRLPNRKRVALYARDSLKGDNYVIAYFKDEELALKAMKLIDKLTGAE